MIQLLSDKDTLHPLDYLKKATRTHQVRRYSRTRASAPNHFKQVDHSLWITYTSVALTSLPLQYPAYRINPILYVLALQRKLHLPIMPTPKKCLCGHTFDIYGNYAFACAKFNKTEDHNWIRDTIALILAETAPYSELVASQADIAVEPMGILPHPSLRSADISLRVFPGALTVSLAHIAILTDPNATDDAYLTSVIQHHEFYENKK